MMPGWYYAEGDPPHSERYWDDGRQWFGEPVFERPPSQVPPGFTRRVGPIHHNAPFVRLGDPAARIGARIIDVIIVAGLLIIVQLAGVSDSGVELIQNPGNGLTFDSRSSDTRVGYLVSVGFSFAWTVLWVHKYGGTPGKLLVGLRVADEASGQEPVTLQQASLRASVYLLPLFGLMSLDIGRYAHQAVALIGLVSFIMLISDHKNRTVMDRIAKTVVVTK